MQVVRRDSGIFLVVPAVDGSPAKPTFDWQRFLGPDDCEETPKPCVVCGRMLTRDARTYVIRRVDPVGPLEEGFRCRNWEGCQ